MLHSCLNTVTSVHSRTKRSPFIRLPSTYKIKRFDQEDSSPARGNDRDSATRLDTIPPQGLVLIAIVSIQLGAGLATHLFPVLGADGTVAVRILFSAIFMGIIARGRVNTFKATFLENPGLLLIFGLSIAIMNYFFYQSIARIPLGAAVAFEFIGPLGVAALNSRRLCQFAWIALAALGIVLLSPLSGTNLDTLGVVFALLAGVGWAAFIILAGRVGSRVPGNDGLAIGMVIAALVMIPFAAPVATDLFSSPFVLLASLGVALLSTTIPFTFEFKALKRLSSQVYGVLVSLEPGVAAIVGVLLLNEHLGVQGMIAITCVVVAAIGITVSNKTIPG